MIDGRTPDPQPGPAPPGDLRPPAIHPAPRGIRSAARSDPSDVVDVGVGVIEALRIPGAHALPQATVEDLRADALFALWRAADRNPHGFANDWGRIAEAAVAAYLSLHLRKGLDELRRQQRFVCFEEWHAPAADLTLDEVIERESQRELDGHLARLPGSGRAVVDRRCAGWSYRRIADRLSIKRNTAIQRYRRAIQRIPTELHALLPTAHEQGR